MDNFLKVKGITDELYEFSLIFSRDDRIEYKLEQTMNLGSPGVFLFARNTVQLSDVNSYCPPTIHLIGKLLKTKDLTFSSIKEKLFFRKGTDARYIFFKASKNEEEAKRVFQDLNLFNYSD